VSDAVDPAADSACCAVGPDACVFTKALLAQKARCALAHRRSVGERELLVCTSPVARINCATLAALMRERSTFALRLPRSGAPIEHAKALRLQCGGLAGLQQALGSAETEVHPMVLQAHERWGSLLDAPWAAIVAAIVAWQPRARRAPLR
jgi:hypothetical protein